MNGFGHGNAIKERKSWVTADWHLGETRFELMSRPFKEQQEMIDVFVKNHNELVDPNDVVHIVGDVCNKTTPEFLSQVSRFNGKKILYRGNHDVNIPDEEFLNYFEAIVPEGEGRLIRCGGLDCWITHYPTQAKVEYFNIVGHIHSAWKVQLNMFNCGVDANHFYPTDIDKIPKILDAISNFYDSDVWVAYNEANKKYEDARGKKTRYFNG